MLIRLKSGAMLMAAAASVSLFARAANGDGLAINFSHILYAASLSSAYTTGFTFIPSSPSTGVTVNSIDFALNGLASAPVRIYSINTSTNAVSLITSTTVLSSDPIITGGQYGNSNTNNTGTVMWNQHVLTTPVTLQIVPNIVYSVVGDVPIGTNLYNNSVQNFTIDPLIAYGKEISNRQASSGYIAMPTTGYFGAVVGIFTVNLGVSTPSGAGVGTTPANLTYNNGSGNNLFDTSSVNFNSSGGEVAYNDSSNTMITAGDNVTFSDANGGAANYNVSIPAVVHPTLVTVNNSTGNYVFSGTGGIGGPGGLLKLGTSSLTLTTSNSYTGGTTVNAGTLILNAANAFPSGTNQSGSSLTVALGAAVTIANHGSGTTYVPIASTLSNSGTIDITNNAMVIKNANASIGTITSEIAIGYNGGSWNGTNTSAGVITSSAAASDSSHLTAVGVATGLTSFQGLTVSVGDVLIKYTYYGDANLDGLVDGSDYSRIDTGFLSAGSLTGWANGDFNYDGVVDGSDYTLIDNAFNNQGVTLSAQTANATSQIAGGVETVPVPEPTTLGILGISAFGCLRRRRPR